MAKRYFPLDALTKFIENTTVSASGVIQRFGAPVVLKIGAGRKDFSLVLDLDVKTGAGNEAYVFLLQGSNDDTFPAGAIENLAVIELGASGARPGGARTSPAGRYVADASNELNGEYRFVRLLALLSGTSPVIWQMSAYLSER